MLWTLKGAFDQKLATAADAGMQSVELIYEYDDWSEADAAKYKHLVLLTACTWIPSSLRATG